MFSLLLRAIKSRVLLAGADVEFPLPLEAVVDVGVATDDEAQLSGVLTAVVVVVVVITVLLVVLLLLLQLPLLLAHVAAAEAGVLLAANPEALVAGTGEAGIYGGVVARLLNGCIRLLTDGGLFDGVPIGPLDMKLGEGLGAGTVLPLTLAPPPPPPPAFSASRLVGVGGILFKTPPPAPDGC